MPIRKPKPTSPGRRFVSYADYSEITKKEPEKSLVEGLKKSGGRNTNGRKTARHRGGGAKRLYRKIDFKRRKDVRPQPRGTAMNPVDHPHGGGEGATPLGNHPQTPWGVPTIGYRTRKKGKQSDRYIVRGRRRGKKGGR